MIFTEKSKFKKKSIEDWKKEFQSSIDNIFNKKSDFKCEKISFPIKKEFKHEEFITSKTKKEIPKSSKFIQLQNKLNRHS